MKKALFFILATLLTTLQVEASDLCVDEKSATDVDPYAPKEIAILDGKVVLELQKGVEFPCIGIRLKDDSLNVGLGTYLEIKKSDQFYLIVYRYKITQYLCIDEAIEDYLKDLFDNFYADGYKLYGEIVWAAFVEEGGLKLFIDISKGIIDEEFLGSPFNETYG